MALTTLSYKTDADVVKTEGPNRISRDEGILASGTAANVSIPGLVVGTIAIGGATPAAKSGGNTGNGVLTMDGTTPVLTGAKAGVYQVRLITAASNGGTFRVTDPEGFNLGDVAVGATFSNDIKFSVADGATDFIVGDGFDITVAIGSGKYAPKSSLRTTDGSRAPISSKPKVTTRKRSTRGLGPTETERKNSASISGQSKTRTSIHRSSRRRKARHRNEHVCHR